MPHWWTTIGLNRAMTACLPCLVLWGCSDQPTLAGVTPGVGTGALVVTRQDPPLPGRQQRIRNVAVSLETGEATGQVNWVPAGDELTFSRDGRWMAWIETIPDSSMYWECYYGSWECVTDGTIRLLYVSRVGSRSKTLVTPVHHKDRSPSFSPDASRLVVLRQYFDGEEQMVTIARDGSDVQPVLLKSDRRRAGPDWAPDGRTILYRRPDISELYAVNPDGSDPRAITQGRQVIGDPVWSPDGTKIAVLMRDIEDPRGASLAVLSASGELITKLPFRTNEVVWAPDGKRLAFTQYDAAYVADVTSGATQLITPEGHSDRRPIWRP